MDALALPLLAYYAVIMAVFCTYGLHRFWMVWTLWRTGGLLGETNDPELPDDLPAVTVQLPMYNEPHVVERLIRAACSMEWPRDRVQIQVLDDSTDETAQIARACCRELAAAGHDVEHVHRTDRGGYKAGALDAGLRDATGEFVAIFDADFVPPRDFLRRTIGHFEEPSIGLVQTRWEHLNRNDSLLTRLQALCLDAHFAVEQNVRSRTGRWFNFNGTAGVWRRTCIDEAGGWDQDTLTEDTDLSYRAQLAGWRFRFLPNVVSPAELPPQFAALAGQQHRWNKGLVQTALKLLPSIIGSRAPWRNKLEAWFHLTSPLPVFALALLTIIAIPGLLVPVPGISGVAAPTAWTALAIGGACLLLGTGGAATFYVAAQVALGRPAIPALLRTPALMALGVGLSVVSAQAIIEALLGRSSAFVRTPKFADGESGETDPAAQSRSWIPPGVVEVLLGLSMTAAMVVTLWSPLHLHLVGVPFLALFAGGYLYAGVARMAPTVRTWRSPIRRLASA